METLVASAQPVIVAGDLERRGRRWMALSFLFCPCHLPWTFALLGSVLGGTVVGAAVREHPVIAGVVIAGTWLAGTARGFVLVRRSQRGELACALPKSKPSA